MKYTSPQQSTTQQRNTFAAATAFTVATVTVLLTGFGWAQADVAEPPVKGESSAPTTPELKLPTNTEDARRHVIELQKPGQPHANSDEVKSAAEGQPTPDSAQDQDKSAPTGDKVAPADEPTAANQADSVGQSGVIDHRARAMAEYRKAREALIEAQKHAKAGAGAEIKALTEAAREQLKVAREQLGAAREGLSNNREAIEQHVRQMTDEQLQEFQDKLKQLLQERRASRASRKAAHQEKLKKDLGAHVARTDIREELATHAWRVARLGRVIELASSSNDQAALKRAENLLALEHEQHKKRLKEALSKSSDIPAANAKKAPPASPTSDIEAQGAASEKPQP